MKLSDQLKLLSRPLERPPLRRTILPRFVRIPCSGQPKPIGTQVARGATLALNDGHAPPFPLPLAPSDGRIIGTEHGILLGGAHAPLVVIELDPLEDPPQAAPLAPEAIQPRLQKLQPENFDAAVDQLRRNGVWADRWTSPDLLGQLEQHHRKPVATVLCNALDLDPVLPLQGTITMSWPLEVAAGVQALARLTGARRALLAVAEDTPTERVAMLSAAAEMTFVRLFPLPDEYPLAQASLLARQIVGVKLPPESLPTEAGVLFLDAAAALAVTRCLLADQSMLRVPLGVYDRLKGTAQLLEVPNGIRLGDVLASEGISTESSDLWMNQVLRELPADPDMVISGGESVVFTDHRREVAEPAACLRCGWCVEVCPVRIHPAGLLEAAQQQDPDLASRYGLRSCIDCGICSYVCPSRLPLLASIRKFRRSLR